MRVLVTAASRHDATLEIARAIGDALTGSGLHVDVRDLATVDALEGYDAVVLGSAVYMGRWLPAALAFVDAHRSTLSRLPVWLFSSGPIGSPSPQPEGEPEGIEELAWELKAREHRIFAGRVDRRRLGFGERAILRMVGAPQGDYRDWEAIDVWAGKIAGQLVTPPVAALA